MPVSASHFGCAANPPSPKATFSCRPADSRGDQGTIPTVSRVIGSIAIGAPTESATAIILPWNGKMLTFAVPCGTPQFRGVRSTSPRPNVRQSSQSPSVNRNIPRPSRRSSSYFGVRTQRLRKSARPFSNTRPWTMPSIESKPLVPWAVGRFHVGPVR
jgi:hypothetical protein